METKPQAIISIKPDENLFKSISDEIRQLEKIREGLKAQILAWHANGGELTSLTVATKTRSSIDESLIVQLGLNPADFKKTTTYKQIMSK